MKKIKKKNIKKTSTSMRKITLKMLLTFAVIYLLGFCYIVFILDLATIPFLDSKEQLLSLYNIACIILFLHYQIKPKKFMHGEEKGTARFSDQDDIRKIIDPIENNNVLFTETEKMSLNTRLTRKNLNQLIIGGSGAGKTRFFIKPNLMQMNTSFVITDPKGEIFRSTAKMLENGGYNVKVFNLIDMDKSLKYNPLAYIKKESDVLKLINNLIKNTNSDTATGGDGFWEKSEIILLQCVIFYLLHPSNKEYPVNFNSVIHILQKAEVDENDANYKSDLDIIFEKLKNIDPEYIGVLQYNNFKMAAGKTTKSILISVAARLSSFLVKEVRDLLSEDTIKLNEIGNEKTALFIIISDSDSTFNYLAAIMYSQLFNTLYYEADVVGYVEDKLPVPKFETKKSKIKWKKEKKQESIPNLQDIENKEERKYGRLKYHVRFMLDEFANIGTIPDFDKMIATMRSREISVSVVIQNLAQIKALYEKSWESITGNCDSFLFLGGNEWETMKYVSEMLGMQTIDVRTSGKSRGSQGSSSLNFNVDARELMKADEIKYMDDDESILFIRGIRPFKSKKINLEAHKNFKFTEDGDSKNLYTLQEYKEKIEKEEKNKKEKNILIAKNKVEEIINNSINIEKTTIESVDELYNFLLLTFFNGIENEIGLEPQFLKIKNDFIKKIRSGENVTSSMFIQQLRMFSSIINKKTEKEKQIEQTKTILDNSPSLEKSKGISEELKIQFIFTLIEDTFKDNEEFKKAKEELIKDIKEKEKNGIKIIEQDYLNYIEAIKEATNETSKINELLNMVKESKKDEALDPIISKEYIVNFYKNINSNLQDIENFTLVRDEHINSINPKEELRISDFRNIIKSLLYSLDLSKDLMNVVIEKSCFTLDEEFINIINTKRILEKSPSIINTPKVESQNNIIKEIIKLIEVEFINNEDYINSRDDLVNNLRKKEYEKIEISDLEDFFETIKNITGEEEKSNKLLLVAKEEIILTQSSPLSKKDIILFFDKIHHLLYEFDRFTELKKHIIESINPDEKFDKSYIKNIVDILQKELDLNNQQKNQIMAESGFEEAS